MILCTYVFVFRNSTSIINDIALLELKRVLVFNDVVKAIELPNKNADYTGTAIVSGWGLKAGLFRPVAPKYLQTVELTLLANSGKCSYRI